MSEFRVVLLFAFILNITHGLPSPPVYDTIVIGLGASGTAAATTLAKAGKQVLALEAQDQVGGRVQTAKFGDSIVELGAEWIHGNVSSPTYELAIKNNVTILTQNPEMHVFFSDGSTENKEIVMDLTDFILAVQHDQTFLDHVEPKDPQPLGQYLTKRILDRIRTNHPSVQNDTGFINSCLEFLNLFVTTYESSNSWNDVSTWSNYHVLGGSQDLSWHTYGYKTLFEILLNTYNNGPGHPTLAIKLNSEVTNIRWPQEPEENAVVTVKDGSTYTAKNVIITCSVGVLKERYNTLFSPPLPSQKSTAIEVLTLGICDKMVFRFDHVWWPANSYSAFIWKPNDKTSVKKEDEWLLKVNTPSQPMANEFALTLWVCGDAAKKMETLPKDEVEAKVMWVVRKFMGTNRKIPDPIETIRTNWYSNPFTRGSYSYDNVDTPKHTTARADLAQPLLDSSGVPRLLFAGEATDNIHFSTVHGAVDTGRREANRLLGL